MKRNTQATDDSRALVVVKDKELGTAARAFFGHTTKSRRTVNRTNGFSQGRTAGKTIPLSKGVAAGGNVQIG